MNEIYGFRWADVDLLRLADAYNVREFLTQTFYLFAVFVFDLI